MRSIPLAMIWETLRHGWLSLIGGALGANLMPALLLTALHFDGGVDQQDPSVISMHLLLIQFNMFCFGAAIFAAQGVPSRLFTYPLTATTLVTWHILPAMALVLLESVASIAVHNAVFDLGWPIWGPSLFSAVAVAAGMAVLWLTEKSPWWMVWSFGGVGGALGLWYRSRYGSMLGQLTRLWLEVTPAEVATLLSVAVIAHVVAVLAVARNRRGDGLQPIGILAWLERLFETAPQHGAPFRTSRAAQAWFEWQKKGRAMPAIVAFGMVIGGACWLLFSRDPTLLLEGLVAGGGLLSAVGLAVGMIMGNFGPNDASFAMSSFLATRPLTNRDFAAIILKTSAQSVWMAWLLWATALVAIYLLLVPTGFIAKPAMVQQLAWWYPLATLLGPWTVVAISASIALTGRTRPWVELFFGGFALFVGLSLYSKFVLTPQERVWLMQASAVLACVLSMMGMAWCIVVAHRRKLIALRTVSAAAAVLSVLVAAVVAKNLLRPTDSLATTALLVGAAALSVAPLATVPLAIAWNRTR